MENTARIAFRGKIPEILERIATRRKQDVETARGRVPLHEIRERAAQAPPPRDFKQALSRAGRAIIAEFKQASPSAGTIRSDTPPETMAREYEQHGAAAISVLTEPHYFSGDLAHVERIRSTVNLPVLRKDFLTDPYQVYEARAAGADAFLLITAICTPALLGELVALGGELGMSPLVEVHDEKELEQALSAGADLIGINNRDLRTFEVDLSTTLRLAPRVPARCTVVAESGIRTREDLELLEQAGVHAFLIGTALMRSREPGALLKTLVDTR